MTHGFATACLLLACAATTAHAQAVVGDAAGASASLLPFAIDGPAPPELPATMTRDPEGRVTVRAVRLTSPLRVDGQLDEALYTSYRPASDFIQMEPAYGEPATQRTEAWFAYDLDNVYFGIRVIDSNPERMVADEMRRDSFNVIQNESIGIAFDTFYDRRNALNFYVNAVGGRVDGQVTNEGNFNTDWNPIWDFATRRGPEGWTAEAAIPFKSIRYRQGRQQIWGVQIRRLNRWKNEYSFLTRLPPGSGNMAIFRMSQAATLVGIEAPPSGRTIDVKPYVMSGLSTDLTTTPRVNNHVHKDFGVDMKYGLTRSLSADVTYNTDFAQVEADEQQVNLTRFSLFFPEKREFFLENAGIFGFGGAAQNSDTPLLFYSRRIGLEAGRPVPIDAGGRVSGRAGRYALGVVNIQTDDVASAGIARTNFSVARVQRNILRRSTIGGIATRRSDGDGRGGGSYGVDGSFAFFTYLTITSYWAKTTAPGAAGDETSYRNFVNYNGDRYGLQVETLKVGDDFDPRIGFVRRVDFLKNRLQARFSPRPTKRLTAVRKFTYQGHAEYWSNGAGIKEQRDALGEFHVELQNGDRIETSYRNLFERVPGPFRIATGVVIPAGGYERRNFSAEYQLGPQRRTSASLTVEHGEFYTGQRTALSVSGARVKVNPHVSIEPRLAIDAVRLPFGDFTSKLVSSRVTYTITPMMFVSGLLQYNSGNNSFSTNLRMRWEYLPGSELFVVYNDGRDTTPSGLPQLQSRALVLKINRLIRF